MTKSLSTDTTKAAIRTAVGSAEKVRKRKRSSEEGYTPYDISFPENCPVEPLGINGDDVYFLDQKRQLRSMKSDKLNQGTIRGLFGDMGELKYQYWPRWSKPDEKGDRYCVGWRPEQAADALFNEAANRGIIDVLDCVRGPGAWRDENGAMVMHCGDLLFHGDKTIFPSRVGRHIYPSAPPKPHPIIHEDNKIVSGIDEVNELFSLLRSWNWRRPDIDPIFLLGWMGASMIGGALKWRPLIWITGDKATGKSTLHDILKGILGPGGLISSTDASAAGLWQTVGHASLPVALDELEAEADNRKAHNIIKLARHAASGGQTLRGGADHKNASFTVRSCFLFSSILMPPMLGQDISRMAVLQLDKIAKDASSPNLSEARLNRIGQLMRGRLLREWDRLPPLIETWKAYLAEIGHGGRSGDQFGTLLACFDLLTSDAEVNHELMLRLTEQLTKGSMAEFDGDVSDTDRCLSSLLTIQVDTFRGGTRRTVGSWVNQAAGRDKQHSAVHDIDEANQVLGNVGLRVMSKTIPTPSGKHSIDYLMVANDHNGLAGLFRDTHWSGQSGTDGVWVQAVRRVNGAKADQQRFNGVKGRCTAVPLDEILGKAGDVDET